LRLFFDTGGFIARFDRRDQYHDSALSLLRAISKGKLPYKRFYTSNYVLQEAVTFVLYETKNHSLARELLDFITKSEYIKILWVDEEVQERANKLFKKYSDQIISMTDYTSAVLMKEHGIEAIFTFDDHFNTLGFQVLP
jgi:predicted nucleic acid-binding protein